MNLDQRQPCFGPGIHLGGERPPGVKLLLYGNNATEGLTMQPEDQGPSHSTTKSPKLIFSPPRRYGYFSGINRKIQFKYLGKARDGTDSESSGDHQTGDSGPEEKTVKRKLQGKETKEVKAKQAAYSKDESEQAKKHDMEESKTSPAKDTKDPEGISPEVNEKKVLTDSEHSLLLILKWGGELTTMGKEQALELGRAFR